MPSGVSGYPLPELDPFPFRAGANGVVTVPDMPEALLALVLSTWAAETGGRALLHVARGETRAERLARAARSFAPALQVLLLPPWAARPTIAARRRVRS